ncbi:MAG: FHA domain-containing protein [Porcipelethomonas sp.]
MQITAAKGDLTDMDNFTEFLGEFAEKLSAFKEIVTALALVVIDICALVIICFCTKEKKIIQKQWSRSARHMVLTDAEQNFMFTLNSKEILLGRHISVDLRFPDMAVSRYHALLTLDNGIWTLRDLDSKSGTYVNGQKISEVRLRPNDEIRIGKKILYLRRMRPNVQ